MKLSTKMTLGAVTLLSLCLCAAGLVLNARSFAAGIADAVTQSVARHEGDRVLLEQQIYAQNRRSAVYDVQQAALQLAQARGAQSTFAVYEGESLTLFSNLPPAVRKADQLAAVAACGQGTTYRICAGQGRQLLLLTAPLVPPGQTQPLVLLGAYDITGVFSARKAQQWAWCVVSALVLALGALGVHRYSRRLTRPLVQLQAASAQMACGNYALRTAVQTEDEIGALSRSFDTMAQAVQSRVQALQAEAQKQTDFVAAFTHEIKTPMTSMLGYAGLLRAGRQPEEVRREAAQNIYRETKRLEALSGKLLGLVGLQPDAVCFERVSVKALLRDLQCSLPAGTQAETAVPHAAVPVAFAPCRGAVLADRVLLDDLLRNLIVNAQRACRAGGAVSVSCTVAENQAAFTVRDTGCGIPPQELSRIAEPFYMVDKSRARAENGSGLGLALCARIAALHGARLEFESAVGEGTTVTLRLPLAHRESEAAP